MRIVYLRLPELVHVAERALGGPADVRDYGLLQSALARPGATVFGEDAYADIAEKAAALIQSLARDHALVDGNKRLSLAAVIAFLGLNGFRLTITNEEAYDLVMRVAADRSADLAAIAGAIRSAIAART